MSNGFKPFSSIHCWSSMPELQGRYTTGPNVSVIVSQMFKKDIHVHHFLLPTSMNNNLLYNNYF